MILDRLEKVTKTGSSYLANCPHCKDPSLTLSLRKSRDTIHCKCLNECRTGDIMRAIDLDITDLYPGVKAAIDTLVEARARRSRGERLTAQEMEVERQAWVRLG